MKLTSFWKILTLTMHFDWEVKCFNFNAAYLNGELKDSEEIYMEQLLGYEKGGKDFVKRLCKALYRLKQVGHRWYNTFSYELANLGFYASGTNPRVFYTQIKHKILILTTHVDNCTMTGSLGKLITIYKGKLNDKFPLTDLGPVHWLLGIKVKHN